MAFPRGNGGTTGGKSGGRSEKSLRLSIKKRTMGLCKKAYELATLCDVELALVCYPSKAAVPTTWPPDRSKIVDAIHHYFEAPAHTKLPKNQITLDNPNPGADEKKDTAKALKAKAAEEADRLRIPFPDDEDKLRALGGILESRLEAVRKMIAVRRTEGRDPRPSARDPGKKLAIVVASAGGGDPRPSARDAGKNLARDQGGPPAAAAVVTAASTDGGHQRNCGDFGPVWGWGHPGFLAATAAAGRGGSYTCPCCYCPIHGHQFTVVDGFPSCTHIWSLLG